jgi:ribosomal protein L20A (L18A)
VGEQKYYAAVSRDGYIMAETLSTNIRDAKNKYLEQGGITVDHQMVDSVDVVYEAIASRYGVRIARVSLTVVEEL